LFAVGLERVFFWGRKYEREAEFYCAVDVRDKCEKIGRDEIIIRVFE
jgi:hypothetical protein